MNYGKIRTDGSIQIQPNPVSVTIGNPNEEQKALMAQLRGELETVYTPQPSYDPTTQYCTDHWEEQGGKAVQVWVITDKPTPETTDNSGLTATEQQEALNDLGLTQDENGNMIYGG